MNPHAAIATISTISLVTIITFVTFANASAPQQLQEQHQTMPSQNEDLLGQLMRLAEQQQQQPQLANSAQEPSGQLKMLMLDGTSKKQKQQQKKTALKKKWHKLVDDLIDESADKQQQQQQIGGQLSAVDLPMARKRPLADQQQVPSSYLQPAAAATQSAVGDSKLMILVKRKPDGNNLDDMFHPEQPQILPPRQPAVNMEQHQRRILDDGFGVLRAAKITTNNHLGYKEMPKFGSDEQF